MVATGSQPPVAAPGPARLPELVHQASSSDEALAALSAANRDLRIERTAKGALIIMPPTGSETGKLGFELTVSFGMWVRADGTGVGFDSSTGFRLPNGAVRSADIAWVRKSRWEALSSEERRRFAPLCPDFVLELLSPTDAPVELKAKLDEFIANGTRLGWLIDPFERLVHVYHPGSPPVTLLDPVDISGESVLPGFVLPIRLLW